MIVPKGISMLCQSVISSSTSSSSIRNGGTHRDDEIQDGIETGVNRSHHSISSHSKNSSSLLLASMYTHSKRKRGARTLQALQKNEVLSLELVDICDRVDANDESLSKLNLCTYSIGNPGVLYLCDFLPANQFVHSINLKYSFIGDEGAISLAYALSLRRKGPPLELLNLSGNHISVLGSEALGIMLEQHSVRELCLSNNGLGDRGFELLSIGLMNVKTLQVNGIRLTDAGLVKCAHTLKHCSVLGISDNQCSAKAMTSLSRHLDQATTLVLSRNKILDGGCASLGRKLDISTISHLDLSHCGIGDYGAALIAKGVEHSSHIAFLSMHSNSIGDTGCTALLDALLENKTLRVLKLWRNHIGNAGAECIGRALSSNQVLRSLQLSFNRISTQGAVGLALGLRSNQTLEDLNLEFNKVGTGGANALLSAMKENRTVLDLKLYPEYHISKRIKVLLNRNKKGRRMMDETLEVCNAIYV